jgi:beta-glucosidase
LPILSTPALAPEKSPGIRPVDEVESRVEALLKQMTLEEKILLLHGDSKFTTAAIPRLGIPRRWLSDGPHGVREDIGPDTWAPAGRTDDFSSYMPVNILLASTWDPSLAEAYGTVIGQEARARGKHIMLGPGVNIMRTPLNGRNFEYFGEDPWLASRMAVGYIRGAQAQGIASCVKHFAANNQEEQRNSVDVRMDDRTLHEIYLPAFRAAVQEAGVWTVMSAYNKFRGAYCSENELLLNQILKNDWGFKGLVVSDWAGVHSTDGAARHGMDLEMGTNRAYDEFFLARPFREGVQNGTYPVALLDDKVRRNLRVMIATGALDADRKPGSLNTPAHQASALQIAEEGMVLLKNERSLLPLDPSKARTIAVIGEHAVRKFAAGGGSAGIKALYEVTALEGIIRRVGGQANVTYSAGFLQPERRRTGAADGAGVRAESTGQTMDAETLAQRAVKAAKEADVVIYVGGNVHGRNGDDEGSDKRDLKLPFGQDALIERVVEANPNTVVVLMTGGPQEMEPWLSKTPAVLLSWYGGMEGGNALARILFGDVNPSGKLPCTFPRALNLSPAHALNAYPGKEGVEEYKEGLYVGYRWYDTRNIEPLFPFGFGLSYTTFGYANARGLEGAVSVDVTNTGSREGSEVVQVYVEPLQPKVERPTKELKGFAKVRLKPGETKTVTIPLNSRALAYYDPKRSAWVTDSGDYRVLIGASSRDIRQTLTQRVIRSVAEK